MQSYAVGFTVHDAEGLVTKRGTIDPLVVVRCCGREYRTEVKRGKASVVSWDEKFIWSHMPLTREEWETAFIEFEVQDANSFWRNDVVGIASIQLVLVNRRPSHQVRRRRLSLFDIEDTAKKRGTLTVTVFACEPGQSPPNAEIRQFDDSGEVPEESFEDLRKFVLGRQRKELDATGKPYHLFVTVTRIEDLPLTPAGALPNPFITVEFGSSVLKSTEASGTTHTFNETFRLPVIAPVLEDTILVRVWDHQGMANDYLIAQGRISFSELRGQQLQPRWYNFYGFLPGESPALMPDGGEMASEGNVYLGRILLSARLERLESIAKMQSLGILVARPVEEPQRRPCQVLADVYEVHGIEASYVSVEVAWGPYRQRTPRWGARVAGSEARYPFEYREGRIEVLSALVPVDEEQQWEVIVSVYSRTMQPGERRVAYHRFTYTSKQTNTCTAPYLLWRTHSLEELPIFTGTVPQQPLWIPLHPLTHYGTRGTKQLSGSVLVSLEKSFAENVSRARRPPISVVDYELRCYIYAARSLGFPATAHTLTEPPNALVEVDVSTSVPSLQPVELRVMDHHRWTGRTLIGQATCRVDKLRASGAPDDKKASPVLLKIDPQWVKLRGGHHLNVHTGDLLCCCEVIRLKEASKVAPMPMVPEWRLCTFYFSLYGLVGLTTKDVTRTDIGEAILESPHRLLSIKGAMDFLNMAVRQVQGPQEAEEGNVTKPLVELSVTKYGEKGGDGLPIDVPEMVIASVEYDEVVAWDPLERKRNWRTARGKSFDFFAVVKGDAMLPELPFLDPRLFIKVFSQSPNGDRTYIGQHTIRLLPLCPWLKNIQACELATRAQEDFVHTLNLDTMQKEVDRIKDEQRALKARVVGKKDQVENPVLKALRLADEEAQRKEEMEREAARRESGEYVETDYTWLQPTGLPTGFPIDGALDEETGKYPFTPILHNMLTLNLYIPRNFVVHCEGDGLQTDAELENTAGVRPSVDGPLEDFLDDLYWPLLPLHRALIPCPDPGLGRGYVKSCFLLMTQEQNGRTIASDPVSADVTSYALDPKTFRTRFRDRSRLPSLMRLRLYIIRAVALQARDATGSSDPYLVITYGADSVDYRFTAKKQTLQPEFYRTEERDIRLPDQSQVIIEVWDKDEGIGQHDDLIGATTIDLEER
ncbi:unnamed protein product [Vitrella brassicaformis CCMP3155]|uniref:C2 domain-containing protein n=1 Tax=Vitrella brassicaformis (strain CCMP3155) TaxID=1169540 RepID=A0A0G4G3J3_VITBC|nr:unnamed protein product [Vitrella brassicaformis CCMP3155]|eukprot:CEM22521.1 unnamed protein product [Vitrella brassicaformis CCMP3155]